MVASNMSGHIQKQLTRSLERILEEAHLSGELKLSGRKLKDFPKVGKTGAAKYNLQDTVIAVIIPRDNVMLNVLKKIKYDVVF
ncbi:leucine-rich repeat and calponin domain-containing protein 1-like protein [Lasius niger]|uniref:Leucine-rich repeat and calponin domain-containing protein 1-like protein n=1 Tax=Lasius niger TaxID=67767 RepID=A0A0J7NYY4_LASNI|nr:leucine-rich repeat and calponin domain-containing protein 1-like protein [Lasius niger]